MMQNNSTIIPTQAKLRVASPKEAQLATLSQNQRNQSTLDRPSIGLKALADKALLNHAVTHIYKSDSKITSNFLPEKTSQKLRPEQPYFGLRIEQLKILAAEDWNEVKDNPNMLKAMVETYFMLKGLDPTIPSPIYTKKVNCRQCGEIQTCPSCPDNTFCCQWCLGSNDLVWN